MRKILHLLPILFLFTLLSCRDESVTPIRNVRFDPNLLNKITDGTPCESYTYNTAERKRTLGNVHTQQVLVVFTETTSEKQKEQALLKYEFVKQSEGRLGREAGLVHTVNLKPGLGCKQVEQAIQLLAADSRIAYAAPYFISGSDVIGLSNEAIVTVTPGNSDLLKSYVAGFNAKITQTLADNIYLVQVDKNSKGNTLALVAYLQGKAGIALAEPDFILSLPGADKPIPPRRVAGSQQRR